MEFSTKAVAVEEGAALAGFADSVPDDPVCPHPLIPLLLGEPGRLL
jgi:hypothetical protein